MNGIGDRMDVSCMYVIKNVKNKQKDWYLASKPLGNSSSQTAKCGILTYALGQLRTIFLFFIQQFFI
jgi:hypothetical protein